MASKTSGTRSQGRLGETQVSGDGQSRDTLRLYCPFYQHDKPSCEKSRACVGPGFKDITRLREHLKKYHREATTAKIPKLDNDQWGKVLAAIEGSRSSSPAAKWDAVYKAIFPQETRPPPFRPTIEHLITEVQRPSELYLSSVKQSMAADTHLPAFVLEEPFLDILHRSMAHCVRALSETGGGHSMPAGTDGSQGGRPPRTDWLPLGQEEEEDNSFFREALRTPSGNVCDDDANDSNDAMFDMTMDFS